MSDIAVAQGIQKTVLENGLTVISEFIPHVRSVSVGVWVKTGTRFEEPRRNGIAHFLEHMMFKGTRHRTPLEIARSLESVGGNLNAYTSKDLTCYYAEILDEHLKRAVDVLADILLYSTFPEKELVKEKQVVLDEIQSLEDNPEELIQDYAVKHLFPDHGLGFSILGEKKTVQHFQREDLVHFYQQHYFARNMIIAAAGNVAHEQLVELCQEKFHLPPVNHPWILEKPQRFGQGEFIYHRGTNQAHLCLAFPAFPYNHPQKFQLLVLNTLLGGGMSSRLFQNIREKYGLAYSIYSFVDMYYDAGILCIYLGTDVSNLPKAQELVSRELDKLCQGPIPRSHLEQTKSQLKGSLMLSLESTARRMSRLGKMQIYLNRTESLDAVLEAIDQVDQDDLLQTAQQVLANPNNVKVIFIPEN